MTDTIIIALISLLGTVLGTFGGIMTSNKLVIYRIQQLEAKVEKHNQVVERVFRLEDNDKLLESRINDANNRINDLARNLGG